MKNEIEVNPILHKVGASKIFVLGDSRTGTMSLHNYLKRQGMKSIHFYVNVASQKEPDHLHHAENWYEFQKFLTICEYNAFSDYPTRSFYKELHAKFPDAFYILTTRKSTEIWQVSMEKFFGSFRIQLDIKELVNSYETVNQDIRNIYGNGTRNFLEICIDDGNSINSRKLHQFLELKPEIQLTRENETSSYDNLVLSKRRTIFSEANEDAIAYVEQSCGNSKAMLSEVGWLYLINDSNDFLRVQYGFKKWTNHDVDCAVSIVNERLEKLKSCNANYIKFIVPEKSIIYSEYLPRAFSHLVAESQRPAVTLSEKCSDHVFYLEDFLKDVKSYGNLYFRGDTHTNWLGSFFVYRFIAEYLETFGFISYTSIHRFADLGSNIAQYDGDLYIQLDPDQKKIYKEVWGFLLGEHGFESLQKYELKSSRKLARLMKVPDEYQSWFTSRKTYVYEIENSSLPKAVIFRDSTSDFVHELLAQHFSRSVFVWHQGQVIADVIELEKPDIVLHIMAERFVTNYPEHQPISKIS